MLQQFTEKNLRRPSEYLVGTYTVPIWYLLSTYPVPSEYLVIMQRMREDHACQSASPLILPMQFWRPLLDCPRHATDPS
jgi:hypothetical protein